MLVAVLRNEAIHGYLAALGVGLASGIAAAQLAAAGFNLAHEGESESARRRRSDEFLVAGAPIGALIALLIYLWI